MSNADNSCVVDAQVDEPLSRVPRIVGAPTLSPVSQACSAPTGAASAQPRVLDTLESSGAVRLPHPGRAAADAAAATALRQHYGAAAAMEGGRVRRLQQLLVLRDAELEQARERLEVNAAWAAPPPHRPPGCPSASSPWQWPALAVA